MAKKVIINSTGIASKIPNYDTAGVLIEYIGNAFDAGAKNVKVNYTTRGMSDESELLYIDSISITDDGNGINYNSLNDTFHKVFFSKKKNSRNSANNNDKYFGSQGGGRFAFSTMAKNIKWETTYKGKTENKSYSILMDANSLEAYDASKPISKNNQPGTNVIIEYITKEILLNDLRLQVANNIKQYFAWYLELKSKQNTKLFLGDNEITSASLIKSSQFEEITISEIKITIKYVVWNTNLTRQHSKIYFIDNQSRWVSTKTTKLNNKSDKFYHSVFVYSELYDNTKELGGNGILDSEQLREKIEAEIESTINSTLHHIRVKENEEQANKLIDLLEQEKVFPEYNDKSTIQVYQHNLLTDTIKQIYSITPDFYTKSNINNKKIFIHLINRIIEQDDLDNLFAIINSVLELKPKELADFTNVLNKHKLNQIINTISLLDDRLDIINTFEQIILSSEGKDLYESRVQEFMESNYWLIGEDFELCGIEDDDFQRSIYNFVDAFYEDEDKKLHKELALSHEHEDINREMDILMGRKDIKQGCFSGTILELKRPKVTIGIKQHRQLEDYKNALLSFPKFNDPSHQWSFYVIGVKIDSNYFEGKFESSVASNKNIGLLEARKNYRLYVKTWSQLFNEFRTKHSYLISKLNEKSQTLTACIKPT